MNYSKFQELYSLFVLMSLNHGTGRLSGLLALWEGTPSVTGEFPSQGQAVFAFSPNKRLDNESSCWWSETPRRSCDVTVMCCVLILVIIPVSHYSVVTMSIMASEITSNTIDGSTICLGYHQWRHQSVTGLFWRESAGNRRIFPTQSASDAVRMSMWWRHHA